MTRSAETATQAAKLAEFKRLITSESFETLEKLEDAVDAFLWADDEKSAEPAGRDAQSVPKRIPWPR